MATTRRIQLTRSDVERVNFPRITAYRMRVDVTNYEGDGVDPYVFIFKRGVPNPYTGEPCDIFQTICGPADLEIPVGEPVSNQNWPFYRQKWVELDFRSQIFADEVWETIKNEVAILLEGIGALTLLAQTEQIWIPSAPVTPPTVSESLSESISASV